MSILSWEQHLQFFQLCIWIHFLQKRYALSKTKNLNEGSGNHHQLEKLNVLTMIRHKNSASYFRNTIITSGQTQQILFHDVKIPALRTQLSTSYQKQWTNRTLPTEDLLTNSPKLCVVKWGHYRLVAPWNQDGRPMTYTHAFIHSHICLRDLQSRYT